jgi:hypothetical protein
MASCHAIWEDCSLNRGHIHTLTHTTVQHILGVETVLEPIEVKLSIVFNSSLDNSTMMAELWLRDQSPDFFALKWRRPLLPGSMQPVVNDFGLFLQLDFISNCLLIILELCPCAII